MTFVEVLCCSFNNDWVSDIEKTKDLRYMFSSWLQRYSKCRLGFEKRVDLGFGNVLAGFSRSRWWPWSFL